MGYPRYLRSLVEEYIMDRDQDLVGHIDYIGYAGMVLGGRLGCKLDEIIGKGVSLKHLLTCGFRYYIKIGIVSSKTKRDNRDNRDQLTRVKAKLYVGLRQYGSSLTPEFRETKVSLLFEEKLNVINENREKADRREAEFVARRKEFVGKIYKSRNFPPSIRNLILERDGYKCVCCARSKEILAKQGLHLEVDHIEAFVDGGLTTYKNGQTLCSECNKAKHHTKSVSLEAFYFTQDVSMSANKGLPS